MTFGLGHHLVQLLRKDSGRNAGQGLKFYTGEKND